MVARLDKLTIEIDMKPNRTSFLADNKTAAKLQTYEIAIGP
jgi:hypothetical protein